jgi:predicted metalloprotease with PDZ domain
MAPRDDGASRTPRRAPVRRQRITTTLVDSPIVAGNPQVFEFVVDGKRHYLVNEAKIGEFARRSRGVRTSEANRARAATVLGQYYTYDKYLVSEQ